jgi:hypothetical protein
LHERFPVRCLDANIGQTGMALPETHAACVNRARACCRGTRNRG